MPCAGPRLPEGAFAERLRGAVRHGATVAQPSSDRIRPFDGVV
jgi:hypothetical protein